jgi:putative tryptophan/tyrosine transport system substrate-binding protein
VPIVFANVGDPVGMGLVASLARPGGNITGFTPNEFGFGAKWLGLLKEIAPRVTRVAVLRDLTIGPAQLSAIQAVAPSFGVELNVVGVRVSDMSDQFCCDTKRGSRSGMLRGERKSRLSGPKSVDDPGNPGIRGSKEARNARSLRRPVMPLQ